MVNGGDTEGSLGAKYGHHLTLGLLAGKLRYEQRPLRQDLCSSEETYIGGRHVCALKRGGHTVLPHATHFSVIQEGKGCMIWV